MTTTTIKTFNASRRLSYDATGTVYEEKPRSATPVGYIEAGSEWTLVAEQKGRLIGEREGVRLAFHPNHLKTKDEAKVAAAIKAADHARDALGLGVQKPKTAIEEMQQLAVEKKQIEARLEAIMARVEELRPTVLADLEALNALTSS